MKISSFVRSAFAICTLALAYQASAAVIYEFDTAGKITGAKGVLVRDKLYNVTFSDGSCFSDFSGCDSPSDFTFASYEHAMAAAQALSTQVFVDSLVGPFDSRSDSVVGCLGSYCTTIIPYLATAQGFNYGYFTNRRTESLDVIGRSATQRDSNYTNDPLTNFARFQLVPAKVPEPSSIALMGLALAGLAFSRRRKS